MLSPPPKSFHMSQAWVHISEIADLHGRCQQILGTMKSRLDKFAARPNANQSYVTDLQRELVTIARYLQASEETMAQLLVDNRSTYQRGYCAGVATMEKKNGVTARRAELGNEGFRYETIAKAKRAWPELF